MLTQFAARLVIASALPKKVHHESTKGRQDENDRKAGLPFRDGILGPNRRKRHCPGWYFRLPSAADGTSTACAGRLGNSRLWLLPLLGLFAWQGWLTLSLFGPDPRAVCSTTSRSCRGRHPLHLYHGYLGARSFYDRGSLCCYDPDFPGRLPQDAGFRRRQPTGRIVPDPGRRHLPPAAYKVGLAVCCLLVPLLLTRGRTRRRAVAGRRRPGHRAGPAGLVGRAGARCRRGRRHRPAPRGAGRPGAVRIAAALRPRARVRCVARPPRRPAISAGSRIRCSSPCCCRWPWSITSPSAPGTGWCWHLALLAGLAGAVAGNYFWLRDWVAYWWIRLPLEAQRRAAGPSHLPHPLGAPLWGGPIDRALAVLLIVAGLAGVVLLNQAHRRAAARLLGLGALAFLLLALAGVAWEPLGRFGTSRLLTPALLFAAVPAAYALAGAVRLTCRLTGGRLRGAALVVCSAGRRRTRRHRQVLALVAPLRRGHAAGPRHRAGAPGGRRGAARADTGRCAHTVGGSDRSRRSRPAGRPCCRC